MIKSFIFNCHKCAAEEKITAGKFKKFAEKGFHCNCMDYPTHKFFYISDMLVKQWKHAREKNLCLQQPALIKTKTWDYNFSYIARLDFWTHAFIFDPFEQGHSSPGKTYIPSGFIPHRFAPPRELAQFQPELGTLLYLAARWNLEMYDFLYSGARPGQGKRHDYTIREVETYASLKR